MDQKFYIDGFEGRADAGDLILPADTIVRLPDQPCRFVQLHNWNVGDDTSLTAKGGAGAAGVEDDLQEIYYGFNGKLIGQIFQGRSSDILPVSNLNQIIVRARPLLSGHVYFAWFW